jgi:hypothetical protein
MKVFSDVVVWIPASAWSRDVQLGGTKYNAPQKLDNILSGFSALFLE